MATKLKSDWAVVGSVVALLIAAISIGYCFSHLIEITGEGWDRSTDAIAYFIRVIKGGTA